MEPIVGFILAVLGIFAAVLSRQLTDEFKAWTPWIIKHLVSRAVRRLAEEERNRCEEEWLSHVNELPGEIGKIMAALGFLYAAQEMSSRISMLKRILDVVLTCCLLAFIIPLVLAVIFLIKAEDGGPILVTQKQQWNGRPFAAFKFRTAGIDERRTRVGRVLRDLNLDQLPTLINVLRGDIPLP
jgi:hypothetical protein